MSTCPACVPARPVGRYTRLAPLPNDFTLYLQSMWRYVSCQLGRHGWGWHIRCPSDVFPFHVSSWLGCLQQWPNTQCLSAQRRDGADDSPVHKVSSHCVSAVSSGACSRCETHLSAHQLSAWMGLTHPSSIRRFIPCHQLTLVPAAVAKHTECSSAQRTLHGWG